MKLYVLSVKKWSAVFKSKEAAERFAQHYYPGSDYEIKRLAGLQKMLYHIVRM